MLRTRIDETTLGAIAATAAFLFWGFAPLYWKSVRHVAADELLAHRVLWCAPLLAPLLLRASNRNAFARIVRNRRTLLPLLASTTLIAFNWYLFVYAVNHDHVLEASLGYYINPLVNVVLGTVLLRERLARPQWIAVAIASLGVTVLTIHAGRPPWIALGLAFSFGTYGLVRKKVAVTAVQGVAIETWFLAPLAIGYMAFLGSNGTLVFGSASATTHALLVLAGAVTATPLILFSAGARRLDYSTVGILQYFAPTGQFLLAVAVFGEPFGIVHAIAFALIWTAVAIYTTDAVRRWRRTRRQPVGPATNASQP